jgi:hypothetical protein
MANIRNIDFIKIGIDQQGVLHYVNAAGAWAILPLGGGGDCCDGTIEAEGNVTIESTGGSIGVDAADEINVEAQNNVGIGSVNGTITVQSRGKATVQSTMGNLAVSASGADSEMTITSTKSMSIASQESALNVTSQTSLNITAGSALNTSSSSETRFVAPEIVLQIPATGNVLIQGSGDATALILPSVTDVANITSVQNGMIVYDSTSNTFKARQNGAWVTLNTTP